MYFKIFDKIGNVYITLYLQSTPRIINHNFKKLNKKKMFIKKLN